MKTVYPIKVTYHRYHMNPSPWINGGKSYGDPEESEAEFMTEEKALEYITRKSKNGTGIDFKIHHGKFEVEEVYI